MSLWGWAISGWLYRTTRRAREARTRRQQDTRYQRAIRQHEQRYGRCLDVHGDSCEEQDCAG
jgi:hypothetical protein